MNQLLGKYLEYKSISNYLIKFELLDGNHIHVKLQMSAFPHLIGLHKLIDIPMIHRFNDPKDLTVNAKYILKKIKKEEILTEQTIRASAYFPLIEERYNHFSKDSILSISYTDVIINFNPSFINSKLKADYILFEKVGQGYNHLCIAPKQGGEYYAESFFYNKDQRYLRGQEVVKIKSIHIYTDKNKLYLMDQMIL